MLKGPTTDVNQPATFHMIQTAYPLTLHETQPTQAPNAFAFCGHGITLTAREKNYHTPDPDPGEYTNSIVAPSIILTTPAAVQPTRPSYHARYAYNFNIASMRNMKANV